MRSATRRTVLTGAAAATGMAAALSVPGRLLGGAPMSTGDLRARLAAGGLGRVADAILRRARPCIRIDMRRVDDEMRMPVGCSKLGGTPDLPAGGAWPAWRGSPLAFVGQVSLADIAAHDKEGDLPHSGLLSFFCAVDGTAAGVMAAPDDPASWQVRHLGGEPATLVRLPPPPHLPERLRFPACQTSFRREPTLPDVESRAVLDLGLSEPERHAYIDQQFRANGGEPPAMSHHLLGYPFSFGQSPCLPGYLHAHGLSHPYTMDLSRPPEELQQRYQRMQQTGPEMLRELQHKAEAEWRLLLQVYSNEEAEMDWGGGGVLHFCIPNDALSRRDFTRAWAEMQFV